MTKELEAKKQANLRGNWGTGGKVDKITQELDSICFRFDKYETSKPTKPK